MAKQTPPNRLDALTAAGLTPKGKGETPAADSDRASVVSEPHRSITEPAETETRQSGRPLKSDDEKATEKVTAYFTPEQYDKIEELQRAHRKRTGKRISVNELLRRLVISAQLNDILRT